MELSVSKLPEHEIADALLAAGANEQVRVRHIGHAQAGGQRFFINGHPFLAGAFGGLAGWIGGGLSALLPDMPAGAVIVLAAAAIFTFSLLFAPQRGVIAWGVRRLHLRIRAASLRGLLAMANGYLPPDDLSYRVVRLRGYIDGDARITESGAKAASEMRRQDRLWQIYRTRHPDAALAFNPLTAGPIDDVLPADIIAALESEAR